MRWNLSAVLAAFVMSSAANASNLDASCNDGQDLEYIIQFSTDGGKGFLFMNRLQYRGAVAITHGGYYTGTGTYCATAAADAGHFDTPGKLCINYSSGTIYIDPADPHVSSPIELVCTATIRWD